MSTHDPDAPRPSDGSGLPGPDPVWPAQPARVREPDEPWLPDTGWSATRDGGWPPGAPWLADLGWPTDNAGPHDADYASDRPDPGLPPVDPPGPTPGDATSGLDPSTGQRWWERPTVDRSAGRSGSGWHLHAGVAGSGWDDGQRWADGFGGTGWVPPGPAPTWPITPTPVPGWTAPRGAAPWPEPRRERTLRWLAAAVLAALLTLSGLTVWLLLHRPTSDCPPNPAQVQVPGLAVSAACAGGHDDDDPVDPRRGGQPSADPTTAPSPGELVETGAGHPTRTALPAAPVRQGRAVSCSRC
ncbi:hypothetical protein I6A84_04565 [Frankia sp. CNm7]|uniref:Uncharacterized protein n=1 Tax=Frankia nepalensis TaxID=1836974 RepID=A0A937RH28_9ACTN|nr:hypothetical protein [Frankia nepalensis]MBL7498723.1 hypothetical protein [Frankia nepalensis]MBL7508412.1 hypothetical protein [Frankia nepalensis]MBL7517412.1 hypothetical protein [Frankia nepalensis]MBL7626243.1 hypothetical protein [Frankia nepalensis]